MGNQRVLLNVSADHVDDGGHIVLQHVIGVVADIRLQVLALHLHSLGATLGLFSLDSNLERLLPHYDFCPTDLPLEALDDGEERRSPLQRRGPTVIERLGEIVCQSLTVNDGLVFVPVGVGKQRLPVWVYSNLGILKG